MNYQEFMAKSAIAESTHSRSLRKAINAHCKECIGNASQRWLADVTLCTVFTCPLYAIRPKRKAAIDEAQYIRLTAI